MTPAIPPAEHPGYGAGEYPGPEPGMIDSAARVLAAGGLVAFPTDTFFGLGADVTNEEALARLFEAKGRAPTQPVPVLLADMGDVTAVADGIPAGAGVLADRFWPGPLTLVLSRRAGLPALVSGGGDTVGVRVPDHDTPRALIRALRRPITGTSANSSGNPPHRDAAGVTADLGGRIDLVVPGACGGHTAPSTVVDCTGEAPVVVREGVVPLTALRAAWPDVQMSPGVRGTEQ